MRADLDVSHGFLPFSVLKHQLQVEHKGEYEAPLPRVRFLVIDNITPIFRPLLSVVSSQGKQKRI